MTDRPALDGGRSPVDGEVARVVGDDDALDAAVEEASEEAADQVGGPDRLRVSGPGHHQVGDGAAPEKLDDAEQDDDGDVVVDLDATPPSPTAVGRRARWAARVQREPAALVLVAAIVLWIAVFGTLIWQRHDRYATFDFDLGHHDQAIWLLSRGKGFITVSGMPVLGHHFTLAYFAVAPLYWLGGGPQLLDVLQTAGLALCAVPLYLYARDRLGSQWQALAVGLVWLLNPTVQWLCWEAWHPETMALPFLLTAYLMATRRRWVWYWVLLVAALTWKEDVALAVIVLGAVWLARGPRKVALLTMALGVVWFVVAYQIAMPHFNGGNNQSGIFYGELGGSPSEVLRTAVTDPDLIVRRLRDNDAFGYFRDLLVPFGFAPLLAPLTLLIAVPQFFANALTNQSFFYDIRFHYAAIIVAVLALGAVEGLARLRAGTWRRVGVSVVAGCALAASVAWGLSPISTQYRTGYWPLAGNARQATLDEAVAAVPDGDSVAASYYLVPHLSHREQIYTFPNPWIASNWGVAGIAPHDPNHDHTPDEVDWIAVDTTTHTPGGREETLVEQLLSDGEFEVVFARDGILVAHRVAPPPAEAST